jgi:ribosomal protein S18 acetylase RimI-like enzyme
MTTQPDAPAAPPASRCYQGLADLPPLIAFASRCTAERSPLGACWHPGDIIWALQTRADQPQPCRFWTGSDGVEALAWFESDGEVWIETLPTCEALVPDAVAWVEQAWRRQLAREGRDAATPVQIRAEAHDARRIVALEALGYRKAGPGGVGFRRRLDRPPPPPELPPGYAVRDSVGVDPALRAAAHRAAWSHLEHLGIHGESRFTTEAYLSLTRLPVYDPSLDMLAVAPDGSFAASCICWADPASGVATFEPVGVALAHRGKRLAGAIMREAMVRLRERGLQEARVGTAHFNLAAIRAYLAAGFDPAGGSHWWAKTLG